MATVPDHDDDNDDWIGCGAVEAYDAAWERLHDGTPESASRTDEDLSTDANFWRQFYGEDGLCLSDLQG